MATRPSPQRAPRPTPRQRPQLRRTPLQRLIIGLGIVGILLSLTPAAVVAYGLNSYSNIDRVSVVLNEVEEADDGAFNVLVVGSDSRADLSTDDALSDGFFGQEAPNGQRSDTIMVVRVNPAGPRVDILSLPRDLWIPVAPSFDEGRINEAYNFGAQAVIDTVSKAFAIDINHYLEVDFDGFQRLVNVIDGVPMYFEREMADTATGLHVREPGCVVLDGSQALAFARSRHLQYIQDGQWQFDQSADLGRISRQQYLVGKALSRAESKRPDSISDLHNLLAFAEESITIDESLGLDRLVEIALLLSDLQPENLYNHSVPVFNFRTAQNQAVVGLNADAAVDEIAIFQGVDIDDTIRQRLELSVHNATTTSGLAGAVSDAYGELGFAVDEPADAARLLDTSRIRFAPGARGAAELVGRHLGSGARLQVDKSLQGWEVALDVGSDFSTVTMEAGQSVIRPAPALARAQTNVEASPEVSATVADLSTSAPRTGSSGYGVIPAETPEGISC
jgi:LCP family protein required for cell wall assembly